MSVALASQHEDAMTLAVDAVRPKTLPRTASAKKLAPHRVHAGAVASRIVADAIAAVSSQGEVARALGVDESAVRHWCNPEHSAAYTLRDVLAGPRKVRVAIARALLAIDVPKLGMCPRQHAMLCVEMLGAVCALIREATSPESPGGEKLTPEERRQIKAGINRMRAQLDQLERDLDLDNDDTEER